MNTQELEQIILNKNDFLEKRQRKKSNYRKIPNETRQQLIEMVYVKELLLKDAAKALNINYSTAKTILRIFRLEKRIEKKNQDENKELRDYINTCIKTKDNTNCYTRVSSNASINYNNNFPAINSALLNSNNGLIQENFEKRKERVKSFDLETNLSSLDCNEEKNEVFVGNNKEIEALSETIKNIGKSISLCYAEIAANQQQVVNLMILSSVLINKNNK